MGRSKKFSRLLEKINERDGSMFDDQGNFIARGNLVYEVKECGRGLYLNGRQIPLSAVRSVTPDFNGRGPLIFVDSAYKLQGAFK